MSATLTAATAKWLPVLWHKNTLMYFLVLDPNGSDNHQILIAGLRRILDQAVKQQQAIALRILPLYNTLSQTISFNLRFDHDMELACAGKKTLALQRPHLWIAEHPLPLIFTGQSALTLYLSQVQNRIRVKTVNTLKLPWFGWLFLVLLSCIACVTDLSWLLAATLGFSLQNILSLYFD